MTRVLFDTSVVVAVGQRELVGSFERSDVPTISAVTLAELHLGLLTAKPDRLSARLATMRWAQTACEMVDVDEQVAEAYGRVAADVRRLRGRKLALADGLIAATAAAHRMPLYTRDRDFEGLAGLDVRVV